MPQPQHSRNRSYGGSAILEGIAIPAVFAVARANITRMNRKSKNVKKRKSKTKKRRVRFAL